MKIQKKPTKGKYLLSEPFLADPNFVRTVIMLTDHGAEGTVGYVLNQHSGYLLSEFVKDIGDFDAPLMVGGPVEQNSLHYIHRNEQLKDSSISLGKGVYWGLDFSRFQLLAQTQELDPSDYKFFLGYSGWGKDQLEDEMKQKSWLISTQNPDLTFSSFHENLWGQIMSALGPKYSMMSNFPVDPSLN